MDLNYSFDDVLIVPRFSDIRSRKDVSTVSEFLGDRVSLPVIASNMDTVTGPKMAVTMINHGAMACLHRFWSINDNVAALGAVIDQLDFAPMVSVGLGKQELDRASALFESGADTFLIDVAHGATTAVVEQAQKIREIIGRENKLIVGNFATGRTITEFAEYGKIRVDAFKIGIGGGSACTTRIVTGCGLPTFSSIVSCRKSGYPIIADGGIRNSGDFAKALAAGADAVMLGRLLAGTDEAPSEFIYERVAYEDRWGVLVQEDKITGKKYRGSASLESYEVQGKVSEWRTPEGEAYVTPYVGPVTGVLQNLEAGLRSAMSYVGAHDLIEFREKAEFAYVTPGGASESRAHGKRE
jgi:IMP dehydrogenase